MGSTNSICSSAWLYIHSADCGDHHFVCVHQKLRRYLIGGIRMGGGVVDGHPTESLQNYNQCLVRNGLQNKSPSICIFLSHDLINSLLSELVQ